MPHTVRVLSFEAEPSGNQSEGSAQTGAFINVYITSESSESAHETARRDIADAGWKILRATGDSVVTEK